MGLQFARQPILLLGMHRSGTAMIARLLDQLGLFQGAELQEDHESVWFLEINDTLLKRVNAAWDHPEPIVDFLANPQAFDLTARCLGDDLCSDRTRQFLGKRWSLKSKSLASYDQPWGWKDPRTLFTLPLWLELFPGAKLVYIVRNGADVARSLAVRETAELQRRLEEFESKPASGARSRLRRAGFKGSARCLTLDGGFSLWEQYVSHAEQMLAQVSNARHIVRYENFLAEPLRLLGELAQFCGLESSDQTVRDAVSAVTINPARANAYANDPAVAAFHARVRSSRWMTHYGYDA